MIGGNSKLIPEPMEGTNKYVLHFTKEELLSVGAFWSVIMIFMQGGERHLG